MKTITIQLKNHDDETGYITQCEKMFSWQEYERLPWSTLAEIFHITISDLDQMLTEKSKLPD